MSDTPLKPQPEQPEVFRQEIITPDGQKHGKVGFDRSEGKDYLRVVSRHGGDAETILFSLDAAAEMVALASHALATKSRPDERSCYAFPQKELGQEAELTTLRAQVQQLEEERDKDAQAVAWLLGERPITALRLVEQEAKAENEHALRLLAMVSPSQPDVPALEVTDGND